MENRDASGIGESHRNKTVESVKSSADRMGHDAAESGRESMGAAKGRVRALFEQQTHRAADQLTGVAHALHSAADQLKDENSGTAARYAGQAAERVEEVADLIRNSTVDDVVDRVEGFARRQPELFLGAAFAAGFLFARFVKSSGERRSQSGAYGGSARYGTPDRYRPDVAGAYPPAGTGHEYERGGYRTSTGGATGTGVHGTTGTRVGGGGSAGAVSRNSATDLGMSGDMRSATGTASGRTGGASGTGGVSGTASTAASGAGTSRMGTTGMGTTGAGTAGGTTRLSQTSTAASMPKPKETLR